MTTVIDDAKRCSEQNWWRKYLRLSANGGSALTRSTGAYALEIGWRVQAGNDPEEIADQHTLTVIEVVACWRYADWLREHPKDGAPEAMGYPNGYKPEPEPTPAPEPETSEFAKAVAEQLAEWRQDPPDVIKDEEKAKAELTQWFADAYSHFRHLDLLWLAATCQQIVEDLKLEP